MLSGDDRLGAGELHAMLQAGRLTVDPVQAELDLRVFNLKTLNDVSKDIYGSVESETIIRNFLLMTMGNFGVMQGFILLHEKTSKDEIF